MYLYSQALPSCSLSFLFDITGTFGRVLECWDRKQREYVAIKIVRNIDKYRHAAMIEVCMSAAVGFAPCIVI